MPTTFSIIRVTGEEETPENIELKPLIKSINGKFALIFSFYKLLVPGDQVGVQMGTPARTCDSTLSAFNPCFNQTTPEQRKGDDHLQQACSSPAAAKALGLQRFQLTQKKFSRSPPLHSNPGDRVKRNLDIEFSPSLTSTQLQGPSPKKQNIGDTEPRPTHVVASLTPWLKRKVKIKVVVQLKDKQRHIEGLKKDVQECVLKDDTGNIKLTAWGRDHTAKLDQLILGKTYLLENMRVRWSNRRFNSTNHDFELVWLPATAVTGPLAWWR